MCTATFFTPRTGFGVKKILRTGVGGVGAGFVDGVFKTVLFIYTVISTC